VKEGWLKIASPNIKNYNRNPPIKVENENTIIWPRYIGDDPTDK
jgi:hypothetical protein